MSYTRSSLECMTSQRLRPSFIQKQLLKNQHKRRRQRADIERTGVHFKEDSWAQFYLCSIFLFQTIKSNMKLKSSVSELSVSRWNTSVLQTEDPRGRRMEPNTELQTQRGTTREGWSPEHASCVITLLYSSRLLPRVHVWAEFNLRLKELVWLPVYEQSCEGYVTTRISGFQEALKSRVWRLGQKYRELACVQLGDAVVPLSPGACTVETAAVIWCHVNTFTQEEASLFNIFTFFTNFGLFLNFFLTFSQ